MASCVIICGICDSIFCFSSGTLEHRLTGKKRKNPKIGPNSGGVYVEGGVLSKRTLTLFYKLGYLAAWVTSQQYY